MCKKVIIAMTKVTGCEIVNQIDNKCYTLYVEWFNSNFKVMLLGSMSEPLSGEMNTERINYFSDELVKSFEEYFEETKKILSGKDNRINFSIENKVLKWKNDPLTLGEIELHSVSDIQIVYKSFQQLLKLYQSTQDNISALEEENRNLAHENKELNSKMERMIEIKNTMEQDLCQKFITILNSKKQRIRELEEIKKKENTKGSVFDASTDESEESEKEDQTVKNKPTVSTKISKRKSPIKGSPKSTRKTRKIDNIGDDKPSTSKDCANNKMHSLDNYIVTKKINTNEKQDCDSKNRKSRSSLTFVEEASDEELFSQ